MDIRIGTILEAVKVPKTKKLMQLKIDTGMDITNRGFGHCRIF